MYRVEITPKTSLNKYGNPIDITQYIAGKGLNKISQKVESSDFSIVQSYDSIRLNFINKDRRFSLGTNKSLFPFSREEARVTVTFTDESGTDHKSFEGLVNDSATYEDEKKENVKTVVVSFDSIFSKVLAPTIPDGTDYRTAIFLCLNQPKILENLNVSKGFIETNFNETIKEGDWFVGKTVQESMDALLLLSNSRIFIDGNRNIRVIPSVQGFELKKRFYGPFDFLRRSPTILSIKNVNTGNQRVFNSITINENKIYDDASIVENGVSSAGDFSFDFVDDVVATSSGRSIINDFLWPRKELEVTVLSKDVQDVSLFDIISIDSPSFLQKSFGQELFPLYDQDFGDQVMPRETGLHITPNVHWEVFEKIENPQKLNCMLKLRETAEVVTGLSAYGRAKYGQAKYR